MIKSIIENTRTVKEKNIYLLILNNEQIMHPGLKKGFIFWDILNGNAPYMNIHFAIFAKEKIYSLIIIMLLLNIVTSS